MLLYKLYFVRKLLVCQVFDQIQPTFCCIFVRMRILINFILEDEHAVEKVVANNVTIVHLVNNRHCSL